LTFCYRARDHTRAFPPHGLHLDPERCEAYQEGRGVHPGLARVPGPGDRAVILMTGGKPPAPNTAPSTAALAIKLALGIVLILIAVRQWRRMGRPASHPPGWRGRTGSPCGPPTGSPPSCSPEHCWRPERATVAEGHRSGCLRPHRVLAGDQKSGVTGDHHVPVLWEPGDAIPRATRPPVGADPRRSRARRADHLPILVRNSAISRRRCHVALMRRRG